MWKEALEEEIISGLHLYRYLALGLINKTDLEINIWNISDLWKG